MASESGKLFPFHNVGLFSDHFLNKRLPLESSYWAREKAAAQAVLDKILAQYKKFVSTYKKLNNALGYSYIPQTYVRKSALALRDDSPKLVLDDIRSLPIRNLHFVTPEKERTRFLGKAKTLHNRCLAKNDFLCVTGFVDNCLKQKPGQADVVHDLLTFLRESARL